MSSVAPAWSPPAEFEEFRLVRYLGGGGMGHVWLAHDLLLDRPVAVKFIGGIEPDAAATERVLAEARAAARLQHPNVAAVYRVGQLGRRPYIISEYVRGDSLDRLAKPLPSARAIELAVQLCRGLGAAHRRGVLHRDLKPANAILADGGEVKLVDFGLAQLFGASPLPPIALAPPSRPSPAGVEAAGATLEAHRLGRAVIAFERRTAQVGGVAGTPYYMAPETWRGDAATPRSELYSLGALLFELCAGRPPFAETPIHELPDAVAARAARPLAAAAPSIDARVAALVDRCLATDAANRPSSADELLESLLAIGDDAPRAIARPDGNPYRGLMPFEA
ncbi:MAG: serine/threonine-protein kinase, partial [Polyangia bacterium]